MLSLLKILKKHRELVANLVMRELKSKYKSSALGLLWSLLTPLFMSVVYVTFLRLLARGVPVEQIIIGVFAWQFTVQCVQDGMNAITGNSNLVKKVFFPRILLPISITLSNLVNYLLSLLVQFPLVILLLKMSGGGDALSVTMVWLPVLIIYQMCFNAGLAMMLSSSNVYFRDTQHLVGVLLSAWFFISPVMYNLDMVRSMTADRSWILDVYMLNPVACIVEGYRAMILESVSFPCSAWSIAGFCWPVLFSIAAYYVFQRAQRNFADLL